MLRGGGAPRIFRLLRGDRTALIELVSLMGGEDQGERRRWQVGLADLVDAILADSIEASVLDFPLDHAFWGPSTAPRRVTSRRRSPRSAIDSMGAAAGSMAASRPSGTCRWPSDTPASTPCGCATGRLSPRWHELFADVTVAADEHLASHAGDLTLGELVTMLGRRADGLTDVWNAWGRLRPLLLEDA